MTGSFPVRAVVCVLRGESLKVKTFTVSGDWESAQVYASCPAGENSALNLVHNMTLEPFVHYQYITSHQPGTHLQLRKPINETLATP
jgi:hypothetical protein